MVAIIMRYIQKEVIEINQWICVDELNVLQAVTILAGGDDMSLIFICTACGEKWVLPKEDESKNDADDD